MQQEEIMARIRVKLADGREGTIEENEYDNTMTLLEEPKPQEKSILEGNLAGKNLVSGDGLLTNILNAVVRPVTSTGQNILGSIFEMGRQPKLQNDISNVEKNTQKQQELIKLIQNEKDPERRKALVEESRNLSFSGENLRGNLSTGENPFLNKDKLERASTNPLDYILDQGKNSIALASLGINPMGATLKQTLGRGALIGASQSLPEARSTEDVLRGGVVGGATAGILSKILGLGKTAQGTNKAIQETILKPKVPTSATMAGTEQKLVGQAEELSQKYGVDLMSGSAKSRITKVNDIYNKIQSSINDYVSKSTTKLAEKDLTTRLKTSVSEEGVNFVPDDPVYSKILDREMKLILKNSDKGNYTLSALDKTKNQLADRAGNAFRKVKGELDSPLTPQEAVRYDLWKSIDNIMQETDPLIKQLRLEQSTLHSLAPGLEKSAGANASLSPLGIPTGVDLNAPIQSAKSATGKVIGKTGTVLDTVLNPLDNQVGRQTLIRGAVETGAEGEQPEIPITETSITKPQAKEGQSNLDLAKQAILIAMLQDAASGGKNITELTAISNAIKELSGGDMDATTRKRQTAINNAEGIYNQVERLALQAPDGLVGWSTALAGQLPGVEGGSSEDLKRVTEGFAKAIAGAFAGEVGVATDRDVARWLGLMPKPGDTKAERIRALQRLKEQIEINKSQFGIGGNQ